MNPDAFFSELAFRDLSIHSKVFRAKLIDEFQLLDNIQQANTVQAPQYSSRDIRDPKMLKKILLEDPEQLIKFQALKRTLQLDERKKDRRLTKTKNINSLPIGAWAAWVVETKVFSRIIIAMILLTAILSGVVAEYSDDYANNWQTIQVINMIDLVAFIIFATEIGLRWTDSFKDYWKDPWNIFDFIITTTSIIPNLVEAFSDNTSQTFLKTIVQIKAFRVLRTLKIIAKFGSLKVIIMTTFQALRSLSVIILLIVVVAFIYGIIGVNLFQPFTNSRDIQSKYQWSFANLGNAMFSLFQLITLDKWDLMSTTVAQVISPAVTYIYFITWVWLGSFIFRNIFVGVMVTDFDRIQSEMAEQQIEYVKQKKFEKMRKKLHKRLETQNPITSLSALPTEKSNILKSNVIEEDERQEEEQLVNEKNMREQEWEEFVKEAMQGLIARVENTKWPRDTLFKYLQLMENLQENLKEFEELNSMASELLIDLEDD